MPYRVVCALLVLFALLAASCGGGSPEEQLVGSLSDGDIEIDENDGGVSFGFDDGEGTMGENLDTPGWVPEGFPLPEGLSIQLAVDEDGVQTILGRLDGDTAPDGYRGAVLSWLDANGYEVLDDITSGLGEGGFRLSAVDGAGRVIDLDAARGAFELQQSMRDVTFDRQDAAETVESSGVATVTFDGETQTAQGECRIQGADYSFEAFGEDGGPTVTLEVFTLGDPTTGSGFVQFIGDEIRQYAVTLTSPAAADAVVSADQMSFGISGGWSNALDFSPVEGSVSVDCGG
ncbi:MAG: hypothetical protein RIE08_12390 [Acidimicrobiales bacterium]